MCSAADASRLRSSLAPTVRPSVKISAAGPSQGSCSRACACRKDENSESSLESFFCAGGTMRHIADAGLYPLRSRISTALSKLAESLTRSSSKRAVAGSPSERRSETSLARSQRRFALMVLISPLCATNRKGCASDQLGFVLVE